MERIYIINIKATLIGRYNCEATHLQLAIVLSFVWLIMKLEFGGGKGRQLRRSGDIGSESEMECLS